MKMPSVMVGMPIGSGSVPWPTAVSLLATVRHLDREGIKFKIEAPMGSSIVQWARSAIAGAFLKSDFSHLFWVDSDIVWTPNDFIRLLGFGAMLDVVCATYPFKTDKGGFLINLPGDGSAAEVNGLGCVKVNSLGLGFTLVKRAVMEKLAATRPMVKDELNGTEYPDIFIVDRTAKGGPRGEDVHFFDDIRMAGYDVWLDPSIQLGHHGSKIYRADPIDALGLGHLAKDVPS